MTFQMSRPPPERGQHTRTEALREVTRSLPAMLRAVKVLKRSADVGLCDQDVLTLRDRFEALLPQSMSDGDADRFIGDLLLSVAGLARLRQVDPEIALNHAVNRFIDRFEAVEREITENGAGFDDLPEETLRKYWNSVKL